MTTRKLDQWQIQTDAKRSLGTIGNWIPKKWYGVTMLPYDWWPNFFPRHGAWAASLHRAHDALRRLADQRRRGAAGRALQEIVAVVDRHLRPNGDVKNSWNYFLQTKRSNGHMLNSNLLECLEFTTLCFGTNGATTIFLNNQIWNVEAPNGGWNRFFWWIRFCDKNFEKLLLGDWTI